MDHAPFIWSSYGVSLVVLAWTAVAPMMRRRRALFNLRQLTRSEQSNDPNA